MTAVELLTDLQRQGFTLIPLPEGKLAVKPAARLNDELRQHIRQRKAEVVELLTRPQSASQPEFFTDAREQEESGWPCPHCGQQVTIDDICLSDDRERTLTLWRCDRCEVVAATPHTIRQPPMGWVKMTEQ